MRKIEKNFAEKPLELVAAFDEKKEDLYKKQINHKFCEDTYKSCTDDLRKIYLDKCAYCESKFRAETNEETKKTKLIGATIEHYRPKSTYWWLAYEWSNLMLVCAECNSPKGNNFGRVGKQVKEPILGEDGFANEESTCANSALLLAEKPLMINPEIENPSDFFSFELDGKIIPKNEQVKNRVEATIKYTQLNRYPLQIKERKRKIDNIFIGLNVAFSTLLEICPDAKKWTRENLCIAFFPTFKNMSNWLDDESEFTLLSKFIIENFDTIIVDEFVKDKDSNVKKIINATWKFFIKKHLEN